MRKFLTLCKARPTSLWIVFGVCFTLSAIDLIFEIFFSVMTPASIGYTVLGISTMNLLFYIKPLLFIEKIQIAISYIAGCIVPILFGMLSTWNMFPLWKFLVIDGSLWAIFILLILLEMKLINIGKIDISDKYDSLQIKR